MLHRLSHKIIRTALPIESSEVGRDKYCSAQSPRVALISYCLVYQCLHGQSATKPFWLEVLKLL